jgi:hypothetical protein
MGRKSRYGHNKHGIVTANRRQERHSSTLTISGPIDRQIHVHNPSIRKVDPGVGMSPATSTPDKEKYAYVRNELPEVGILTVIIIAILIVTALLLR